MSPHDQDAAAIMVTLQRWRLGEESVIRLALEDQQRIELVLTGLVDELRRKVGGRFLLRELVEFYERGTDWCLAYVAQKLHEHPALWDARLTADPAFARYSREAADFAGGRYIASR